MMALDLSLYLVLDPDLCGGLDGMVHTAQVAAEHGVTVVQLRAPHWKKRSWYQAAQALQEVLAPYGVPLIINDQVDVALAVDAAGVHVGQADLPVAEARRLLGPDKILGLSISHRQELRPDDLAAADYLGIGPVYPTTSKADAAPACGLDEFAELVRLSAPLPVVAIGGMTVANCATLFQAGASGVAVVSAICGQADLVGATRRLSAAIQAARVE